MTEPTIYEQTIGGAHKVRSFKRAIRDLQTADDVIALAISDANPAACWVRVTLDNEDPDFVWVTQTDVNSAKNEHYAMSTSWRESVQDFEQNYRFELEDYRLSRKREEASENE